MDTGDGHFARYSPYLERYVLIVLSDEVLHEVSFSEDPPPNPADDHPLLDRITDYLTGTVRDGFENVAIDIALSSDDREVLETLREVSYGSDISVEQLVRMVPSLDTDHDPDHDYVREVLDRNPIPIIIPDHRVRDGPSAAPPSVEQRLRSLEQIVT